MKKLLRFLAWSLALVSLLVVLFFTAGYFAKPHYQGAEQLAIKASPAKVWQVLNNTETFVLNRHEVTHMEMLAPNAAGMKSWVEYTRLLGSMNYEVLREVPNELLEIRMIKSDFGLSGVWTFSLQAHGDTTEVTLSEDSENKGLLMRSILTVLGRNANVRLLLQTLKKQVEQQKAIS